MTVRSPSAPIVQPSPAATPIPAPVQGWLWEARTRILLWYVALLVGLLAIAVPLMSYRVLAEVEARVRDDIEEELEAFEDLQASNLLPIDQANIDRINQEPGRAAFTTQPQTAAELSTLMEVYLRRRIPEDDTFLIAVIDGELYRSSPTALPSPLRPGMPVMDELLAITEPSQGEIKLSESDVGDLIYYVEPVGEASSVSGEPIGTLLVVHTTRGEIEEAIDALDEVAYVLAISLVLALVLGWLLSGRVLAPLRQLNSVAKQVNGSDLSRRIPIQGKGELANLSKTFNAMMDRLEAAFQGQRYLLNDIGHELRTPITIIRGHLELLDNDPVELEETRELVLDEIDRMARLVDELILLAKMERPDFLQIEPINVQVLMDELFAKSKSLAERNWQLEAQIKPQTIHLRGDRQRLTEAVLNLAENAVQHTQPQNRINLGCRQRTDKLELWVADDGDGISAADQQRIFERFMRGSGSRRVDGSGLGLTIVKTIAEAHGGWVELDSQPGQGARFVLILPLEGPQ